MDIKKARDGIAAAFSVDTLTASRLIGFYNGAGDVATVAALVAGDYSSIPAAAAALGVSLQGVGDDRPAGGGAPSDGSIKNDNRKAANTDDIKADTITAHNSDILPDTAQNRKADKIPTDSKSKQGDIYKSAESSDDLPRVDGDILSADNSGLPDGLPDMIHSFIDSICQKDNTDLKKERQTYWKYICMECGSALFKKNKILHDVQREKTQGGIYYDFEKLSALASLWGALCFKYNKSPMIDDFARFAGVSDTFLYGNGSSYAGREVTPARVALMKKLHEMQERGLAGLIVDGRQNPTGALAALNHYHGWTQSREIIHTTGAAVPVAPSLPVFDGSGGLLVDNSAGGVDN